MIHVLVVEDSSAARELVLDILRQDSTIHLAGVGRNGREAVTMASELKPDVILMDVHMPVMNGLEATREIMQTAPVPIVLMSATSGSETAIVFEAIRAGAVTIVDKPKNVLGTSKSAQNLVDMVKAMAEVKVVRRWRNQSPQSPAVMAHSIPSVGHQARLIAIGASTGGPQALTTIFQALPDDLGVPIVLVQHITPGFAFGIVEWLNSVASIKVKIAEDGERLQPNIAYLAPDGVQMVVGRFERICLSTASPSETYCPSIDRMFESVADTYGSSALGVILTGMGRDGAYGLRRMRESGAVTIAQDEATSAVYGMPKEAVRLGAAMYVLPLGEIAGVLCRVGVRRT